jgi:hypothetical protein
MRHDTAPEKRDVHLQSRPAPPPRRIETLALVWWSALTVLAASVLAGAVALDVGGPLRGTSVPPDVVLLVVACLGTLTAALARWGTARTRGARVAVTGATAVVLGGCLALVNSTVLAALGYLPAVLIVSAFDPGTRENLAVYADPALGLQVAVLIGAALLAAATVVHVRRGAGACRRCGRRAVEPAWKRSEAAARWGRVAALVAAAVPAVYGLIRIAWAVGIPLGISDTELAVIRDEQMLGAVGLGAFALVGTVLTLGLYQRWGEVFPRWMIGLAGRRVPVGLAVVPATLVAVAVMPAAVSMIPPAIEQGLIQFGPTTWGAGTPILLWPLWSLALGAATYAYWLRRRGACGTCGQG